MTKQEIEKLIDAQKKLIENLTIQSDLGNIEAGKKLLVEQITLQRLIVKTLKS